MNTKKLIALTLTLSMALSFTACKKHEHEWIEATCTQPRTCATCEETEGEALGHTWTEATCTQPRTCAACGETEGEALGHTWAEATYQAPATCTVCGETDGEPLTPDFVTHEISLAEQGQTYDCTMMCQDKAEATTVTHVTVSDYRTFDADDTHPAKEGYEYRQAAFTILCDDDNANAYGVVYGTSVENYYDILSLDDSSVHNEDGTTTFTVNIDGREQECLYMEETSWEAWVGRSITGHCTLTVQVPVGYDGVVVGVRDNAIQYEDGLHLYDIYQPTSFVLFRLA